jgi:hypothetical protein
MSLMASSALAERGRRPIPPGAQLHPESTLSLYRTAALARRLQGTPEFSRLPPEIRDVAANLTDGQVDLLGRYDAILRNGTNPRLRQVALEQLHRTFWEVVPAAQVERINEFAKAERVTSAAIAEIARGQYNDATTRNLVARVREDVDASGSSRRAEEQILTARRNLFDTASQFASTGVMRDVVHFAHQDGVLGQNSKLLGSMQSLLTATSEALGPNTFIGRSESNRAFVQRAFRKMSDYAMIHESPDGLADAAMIFGGVLKGANTSGNLAGVEGMLRLIDAPVEAARAELLDRAGKAGVLEALKAKVRREMEAEGKKPTDEEVAREISLRDLRQAIEGKLLNDHANNPQRLQTEISRLDEAIRAKHDQALGESLAKLLVTPEGRINPDRLNILKRLFAKPKRGRACLNKRLLGSLGGVATAVGAIALLPGVATANQPAAKQALQAAIRDQLLPCAEGDEKKCPAVLEMSQPASGGAAPVAAPPANIDLNSH